MKIWVIEELIDGKWVPTVDHYFTKRESANTIKQWVRLNPNGVFRVTPYVRVKQ